MNVSKKIAIAALLVSAFASPSFAQLGVGADPVSDGRALPTVYATTGHAMTHQWTAPRGSWSADMAQIDRLSQGHN